MRPFGSLGPKVDVAKYDEQLAEKALAVKQTLAPFVPESVLDGGAIFSSPPTGHRHRAGPFVVRPGSAIEESALELAMWDPVARDYSIVRACQEPIYSAPIAATMEELRRLPIVLDTPVSGGKADNAADGGGTEPACWTGQEHWGRSIGRALRAVQLHSTMSGDLLICLTYHDERLRALKRGEQLPGGEGDSAEVWLAAAREFQSALRAALAASDAQANVEVVGRWKRRRLAVSRDSVTESFTLSDGRTLSYQQPEGQFSNPNAPCEVHCLDWLCDQAAAVQKACRPGPARLLELHCGGGNNTVALAPYFDEVLAVEINRVLADAAEENLRSNGVCNVQLVRAPSATMQGRVSGGPDEAELQAVLVDPPRSGLDEETRTLVASFQHVLYISCNPDALAADLAVLNDSHVVLAFALFDMFPFTTHVECAVRLQRR